MDWIPIAPLTVPGSDVLNRNIAHLLGFRKAAEATTDSARPVPTSPDQVLKQVEARGGKTSLDIAFFKQEDAVNEALRREYMLRRDIAAFLQQHNIADPVNDAALATLNQMLKDRAAHTGGF